MTSQSKIYQSLSKAHQERTKQFALLIDPDQHKIGDLEKVLELSVKAGVDYLFVGGSLIIEDRLEFVLQQVKALSNIPTVLFPSSPLQVNDKADAILFLSLLSGRNPELLIGNHVIAAPYLKKSNLEILPTGYLLIDGGQPTTASYMSNTTPIPSNKKEIAVCTAMAGEMLGLKLLYLDGGSGAHTSVPAEMISAVRESTDIPLIIGGGIRTPEDALEKVNAGADVIVVGNAVEKDPALIMEMVGAIKKG